MIDINGDPQANQVLFLGKKEKEKQEKSQQNDEQDEYGNEDEGN